MYQGFHLWCLKRSISKLDNERMNNDGSAAVQLIPGVSIDQMQTSGPPLSDPQALPGAPQDAPIQLR